MSIKNGLLQIYSEDLETSESVSGQAAGAAGGGGGPSSLRDQSLLVNWDVLQEKVDTLERDNQELRDAATDRFSELENEERKEQQLIQDCMKQLSSTNDQLSSLQEEIARRAEDNVQQQEEITNLLTQVVDLQKKNRDLVHERDGYRTALSIARDCQNELSIELIDVKEKYEVLLAAFQELQQELKRQNRSTLNSWPPSYIPHHESLAAELESSGYESEFSSINTSHRYMSHPDAYETRCETPDSLMSTTSSMCKKDSLTDRRSPVKPDRSHRLLVSNKLKIVKSFEGSETLNKWKKLATPHLGVVLESHSGVQSKAHKDLNQELLQYVLDSSVSRRKTSSGSEGTAVVLKETAVSQANACSSREQSPAVSSAVTAASDAQKYEPHPGRVFDTSSTFTFTTTSLSRSTDSTIVTPSFSQFQLATGHQTPITASAPTTSTSCYSSSSCYLSTAYSAKVCSPLFTNEHPFSLTLSSHNLSFQVTAAVATTAHETTAGPFSYFWNHSVIDPYKNCVNFITNYANPMAPVTTTSCVSSTATSSSQGTQAQPIPGSSVSPAPPSTLSLTPSGSNTRQKAPDTASGPTSSHQSDPAASSRLKQRMTLKASSSTASLPQKELRSPFGLDAIAIEMLVPSAVTPGIVTRGQGFKLKATAVRSGRKALFEDGPDQSCGPTAFTGRLSKMKTLRKGGYV